MPAPAASVVATVVRGAPLAAVACGALVVGPGLADRYNAPKFVLLVAIALGGTVAVVFLAAATRTIVLPRGALVVAVAAFVAAAALSAAVAPATGLALFGTYGRYDGLFTLLACVALFLVVAATYDEAWLGRLRLATVVTAGVVALVGVIEAIAKEVSGSPGMIRSSIGNPDFVAAFVGIGVPASLSLAMDAAARTSWRAAGGLFVVLDVGCAATCGAQQGLAVAVVGLAVMAIVAVSGRPETKRRWTAAACIVLLLGVALVAIGMAAHGPAGALGHESTVERRRFYWGIAWRMFAAHPVIGVGLGSFGDHYFTFWSVSATHALGVKRFADAASCVPLTMFAEGGLLLGLSYLAVIGLVVVRLGKAVWRGSVSDRWTTGGLAGAWVAYQAQSLVSIDKVSLIVVNWVLGGALVASTGDRADAFLEVKPAWVRGGRGIGPVAVATTAAAVLAVTAMVPFIRLWRAETTLSSAVRTGSPTHRASDARRAAGDAGWQPFYWVTLGDQLVAAGDARAAPAAFRRALKADPLCRSAWLGLGAVEAALGDFPAARSAFQQLARFDRHDPVLLEEIALVDLRQGDSREALRALRVARRLHPDRALAALTRQAKSEERDN